jgi:hypothetical protein
MLTSDPVAREGKRKAELAATGRNGNWRLAVWVDSLLLPSRRETEMPGLAGRLLVHGASWVRKWEVHPESAMMGSGELEGRRNIGDWW